MLTLALDASTYTGTVAVVRDSVVVAEREVGMRGERAERLMPAVAEALRDAEVEGRALERIVCGAGPGSFTSLRIAASIAKGLAMSRDIPLYSVSSLLLLAAGVRPALPAGRYLSVLGAMRGEAYILPVEIDVGGAPRAVGQMELLGEEHADERARAPGARAVGPGRSVDASPHARGVVAIPAELLGSPVDLDSWEPDYGRLAEAQVRWEAAHGRSLPRT